MDQNNFNQELCNSTQEDFQKRLHQATKDWQTLLVETDFEFQNQHHFNENLEGISRQIPIALRPHNVGDISVILKVASQYSIPIYPISGGRNWGYGTASPVKHDNVILDLTQLNKIIEVDNKAHWVRLEPGVTQGQLHEYLKNQGLNYMVPTTGAGPEGSIVGNLLERGYGITPHADHFAALLSLKAVLPSGQEYQSPLAGVNANLAKNFKWGIGPYFDGIFAQGNFAVVTEATVALAPRPEQIESFYFSVDSEENYFKIIEVIAQLRSELGSNIGGVNLMNQLRMLSMTTNYPWDQLGGEGVLSKSVINKLAEANSISLWSGVGSLYGTKEIVKAVKKHIQKRLKPYCSRIIFVDTKKAKMIYQISSILSFFGVKKFKALGGKLIKALEIMSGIPNDTALPLLHWRNRSGIASNSGLLWYAPLVPKRPELVKSFNFMVQNVCRKYGFEPLITLTSISERCFDSTVPILFDKLDLNSKAKANSCLNELLEEGIKLGVFPYRLSIDHMHLIRNLDKGYCELLTKTKKAIDPHNILAPGRYSFED